MKTQNREDERLNHGLRTLGWDVAESDCYRFRWPYLFVGVGATPGGVERWGFDCGLVQRPGMGSAQLGQAPFCKLFSWTSCQPRRINTLPHLGQVVLEAALVMLPS